MYKRQVVSLEIDERLLDVLEYTLDGCENVKGINRDVLKTELRELIREEFGGEKISVAANLPYYITTPIISKLLEERLPLKNIVVMVPVSYTHLDVYKRQPQGVSAERS